LNISGIEVDASFYQFAVVLAAYGAICAIFVQRKVDIGFTARTVLLVLYLLTVYNLAMALMAESAFRVPLFRGIYNLTINVLTVLLIDRVANRWLNTRSFARAVAVFGILVALSGLGEFAFLKMSRPMLMEWRRFVWGGSVTEEQLFTAGGVTLDPIGLARVGGLVGAPENLGVVLALTLHYVALAGFTHRAHASIFVLYLLAAVVSASRTLGLCLGLYGTLLMLHKEGDTVKHRIAYVILLIIFLTTVMRLNLNSGAFTRFGQDALAYEWMWRSKRLLKLLNVMQENGLALVSGLGLGWGVDQVFGLRSLTSGVLGGDLAVGYGLGGVVGLAILILFWRGILKVWIRARHISAMDKVAIDLYVLFLFLRSIFTPVVMRLILSSDIITFLTVAFLVVAEARYREWARETVAHDKDYRLSCVPASGQ
jgi:hypothetical protein